MARASQRDVMRAVHRRFGSDHDRVVAAYAAAERRGDVQRASNVRGMSPEEYADRFYRDGIKKRWLPGAIRITRQLPPPPSSRSQAD